MKLQRELLEFMRQGSKQLLGFSDTVLVMLDKDKLIFPASAETYRMHDGLMERAYASPTPLVFDLEALGRMGTIPGYLQMPYEDGVRLVCIVRLMNGRDVLGFWLTYYDGDTTVGSDKTRVIEGLASVIAIALSGIAILDPATDEIHLHKHPQKAPDYADLVGGSRTMQQVFHLVKQVAPSDSTVLILGETGTGKELIARAIHQDSPRRHKTLVKVNCAALPANLIESELFGHERGSFTGAIERRIGKFELADGGTLFLDEIGEMPLELQVKLLRALQEREIERIGGKTTIKVNTRIVAATNRDLEQEMIEGRFRSDLYYRLNIFPIELPPLRDRKEDIPHLVSHFIQRYAKRTGKQIGTLSNGAMQELMKYHWPGNVRELEHLLERSVLLASDDTIRQVHLPAPRRPAPGLITAGDRSRGKLLSIDEAEREHIMTVIRHCRGRISGPGGAADILGVPASTLNSKMKRLGIKKEHVTSNSV